MTNYDLILSTEYKYLIYLVEELNKLEVDFKKLAADRDVKLTFLLKKDISAAYDDVIKTFEKNDLPNLYSFYTFFKKDSQFVRCCHYG